MQNGSNTILLINDEPALCRSLALMLRRAGYKVTTAADEAEALEHLLKGEYDLVCLDLKWEERNGKGVSAIREICQRCPGTPVLLLSDSPHENAILQKMEDLHYESMVKPLDPPQFIARVNSLLTV
jgi:DNA-binding response OmpR family regulator